MVRDRPGHIQKTTVMPNLSKEFLFTTSRNLTPKAEGLWHCALPFVVVASWNLWHRRPLHKRRGIPSICSPALQDWTVGDDACVPS